MLEEIEKISIRTSQGSFVKLDSIQKMVKDRREKKEELERRTKDKPPIKTVEQARQAIKDDPELMKAFGKKPQIGKSVAADV